MAARKQYLLRIDPALWAEVEKWAADELRSVNAQIEYLLRLRILGESGRRAAEVAEFGEEAHSFEGRTVYPDGREVLFNIDLADGFP